MFLIEIFPRSILRGRDRFRNLIGRKGATTTTTTTTTEEPET